MKIKRKREDRNVLLYEEYTLTVKEASAYFYTKQQDI